MKKASVLLLLVGIFLVGCGSQAPEGPKELPPIPEEKKAEIMNQMPPEARASAEAAMKSQGGYQPKK